MSRFAILGLLAGLVAPAFAAPAQAQPAPAAAPSHIAVVDLRAAYQKLAETKASNEQLKGMQDELEVTQRSHKRTLEDLQASLGQLKDSSKREETMDEIYQKGLQFDMEEKGKQIKMARQRGHQLKHAFDSISAAVADYAKKHNIDAVLVNSSIDLPDNIGDMSNQDQLVNLIFNRSFLYVSPSLDITEAVVAAADAAAKTAPMTPAGH
jgi:Skp family chaperone for outer membrane proteins